MDLQKRQELFGKLMEIKKLVDEVLPLESSMVKDLILGTLFTSIMQQFFVECPSSDGFQGKVLALQRQSHNEEIAMRLTEMAAEKGKKWVKATFSEYMDSLKDAH